MSALVLKIIVIVVFFVALLRIRNTAAQLIKHGYVASRTVLYLHIGFSVFDLVSCFVIAASALEHADAAQKTGTEGSGYKVLSALNFNQMYQVPNSLMMLVVLYFVNAYIRAAHQKGEEAEEDLETQVDEKLES